MSRLNIIHHERSDRDHNFQEHVITTRRTFLSAAAMGTAAALTPLFAQGQPASGAAAAGAGCEGGGSRMIKMTMFLKRKAGLSREAFVDHHIKKHGPLFRSIPEASEHVLRYIQTHPLEGDVSPVKNADFDGTAEIWFDSLDGLRAVLTSRTYKEKVFPDEKTFLDHANTLTLIGDQVQIIPDQAERIAPQTPDK